MNTNEKIARLREKMKEHNLFAYYVNTADPHQSEYVTAHFQGRAWLTGFSGSAGYALVTADKALLWADGRYFIQAAQEIAGSEFELMKMGVPGVPTLTRWLRDNLPENASIGMDGRLVSEAFVGKLSLDLKDKTPVIVSDFDLVGEIWEDRPALPDAKVWLHDIKYTGKFTSEKLRLLREKMTEDKVDFAFYAGLDDICWLFNFRGGDVPYNPVTLSFALISQDKAELFIDLAKTDEAFEMSLKAQGVTLAPYEEITTRLAALPAGRLVLDKARIGASFYSCIPAEVEIISRRDYPQMMKSILNEVELANYREVSLRDSAALTRFIYQLKQDVAAGKEITEYESAEILAEYRRKLEGFVDLSFSTIAAYGANAAMMHYGPTPENSAKLEPHGMFLVDSGGQYLGGTTDITRTLSLGEVNAQEKFDYTLTLKGHADLAMMPFLKGSTGHYLEVLSRAPMWKRGLDYKSGTGHSVGYLLGVHEGPRRISSVHNDVPLDPNSVVTIEPGVYRADVSGVRIENDYVVQDYATFGDDIFYRFETLTHVPLDRALIDVSMLTADEIAWVNQYQAEVLSKLTPFMENEDELNWLKAECAPLS